MTRQIRLHAFEMATIGHIQQGLWRHPRDRATRYTNLSHWVSLAQTLERGLFDGLFLADVLGIYDVFGASPAAALRHAVQVPNLDPSYLVPAMAHATTHLGFAITVNSAADHPVTTARRFSTLDHLTNGRIGWNVVTGYLDSAARALGLSSQVDHDSRYDAADTVLAALQRLWREGWEDGAVLPPGDDFADAGKIHTVAAAGEGWRMDAVHLCEPSPQRSPVIYQAGASARGLQFAARHAECVFVNATTPPQVARLVTDLRAAAAAEGRHLRVFAGMTVVTAATQAEAEDKCADYENYADTQAALVQSAGSMGIDFAALAEDDPIPTAPTQAIASNLAALPPLTKAAFRARLRLGGRQPPVIGSPAQVADTMQDWMAEADLDGFVLSRTVAPECFVDIVDLVVPELQRRDAYKVGYTPGTLREKLFA